MNNKPNNMKNRQRGRNNNNGKPRPMGGGGGGGGGGRNQNFDGGQRMRGNAQQLMEKYLAMARDASMGGDRVLAENYFQHADHYYRVLNARFEQQQQNNGNRQQNYNPNGGQNYNQGGYDGDQQSNFNEQPHGQQPYQGEQQHQPQQHQPQHQPQQHQPQQHQQPPQYQHAPQPEQPREQPREHHREQPAARPAQNHNEDIGLPPGILGMSETQEAPASGARQPAPARAEGGEEDRAPRTGARRRRGRGGDRQNQTADAE